MKKRNLIGTNLKNIRRLNNLSQEQLIAQLNLLGLGVWNLVLSCKSCNRGENGKFAKLADPDPYLIEMSIL